MSDQRNFSSNLPKKKKKKQGHIYKLKTQKSVTFPYASNEDEETKLKTIPSTIAKQTKKIP